MRRAGLPMLAFVLLASGCSTAAPEASTAAPPGVSVSMYQTRTDVAPRRLELAIQNGTDDPLRITGARLLSSQFAAAAEWQKASTTIPPGATVDLPVQLPDPDCTIDDPVHTVEFDYESDDGMSGTARVIADDRLDRMPALRLEDCLQQSVTAVVELTISDPPRRVQLLGHPVIEVDLRAVPTGGEGSVILDQLASTTLLTPIDPATGLPAPTAALGVTIAAGDAPSVVTLLLAPGRCDPHAIAEDKRGTIMPIDVRVGQATGRLSVPSSDAVRGALYALVTELCATTPGG